MELVYLRAEGVEFWYVPGDQSIDAAAMKSPVLGNAQIATLLSGPDTRLAYFRSVWPPESLMPYWLLWQNWTDLIELDRQARTGQVPEDVFKAAIRTEPQNTQCARGCKRRFLSLVATTDPYAGEPHLALSKVQDMKVLLCPHCGAITGQLVGKILE